MEDSQPPARKQKGKGKATKMGEGPVKASFMTTPEKPQRRTSRRLAEDDSARLAMEKPSRPRRFGDADPAQITVAERKTRVGRRKDSGIVQGFQEEDEAEQLHEPQMEGTKIALPFADTPVIRRNKEMRLEKGRKGQRRSSLGLRGRRASSLIESGASNGA
jgi:kinetochore protein Mis13/DSN1